MVKQEEFPLKLSAFFELTPDLVCVAGKDGYFKKVNPAVIEKLEYTESELMTRPIDSFIHPEDSELTRNERNALLNGKVLLNFQNRYVTKSGSIVWLEWTSIYFSDREIVFAIAKDVTQKKLVEKEIEEKYKKFKSLATHFKSSIEEDRKYLANELHAELAQLVAALKMDVDWLNGHLPEPPAPVKNRIDHALVISEMLINTIRRITFTISPNMLEDLGLHATLDWYSNEFSVLNGISCSFKSNCNENALTHEVKVDFFRISQDALTNIMYHAQAGNAEICLEDTGNEICLIIRDDGIGFDMEQPAKTSGLTRMRERAASINGRLTIQSKVGKGTMVCVTIAKH